MHPKLVRIRDTTSNIATTTTSSGCDHTSTFGRLPLEIALTVDSGNHCSWENGVQEVVQAYPNALNQRDISTKLYPFLLAATIQSKEEDDDCCGENNDETVSDDSDVDSIGSRRQRSLPPRRRKRRKLNDGSSARISTSEDNTTQDDCDNGTNIFQSPPPPSQPQTKVVVGTIFHLLKECPDLIQIA